MPHIAAQLRRHVAGSAPEAAFLSAELADHWWMSSLRRQARTKEAPAALRNGIRALEDALFDLVARPRLGATFPEKAAQDVLIAVGRLGRLIGTRPNLQKEGLHPPPMLTYNWAAAAYDGTAEFRIAAALACLHAQAAKEPKGSSPGASGEGSGLRGRPRRAMPMRCHLAPLDPERGTEWDPAAGGAMAVWGHGSLVSNLCAVAQRRLIEQTRRALADKPFATVIGVGGEDIAAFLDAGPGFDDRVGNLLAGLVWVRWPGWEERKVLYERWKTRPGALLLTYAALKPLFTPDAALRRLNPSLPENFALPIPPALPGLLAADRVEDAVRLGMTRARSSGLLTPFGHVRPASRASAGRRLLAALMIPVRLGVVGDCIRRAYPAEEEAPDAA